MPKKSFALCVLMTMTTDRHMANNSDRFCGAANIALIIGCSCWNVYALKKRGLPVFKCNGQTLPLVPRRAKLLAWLLERECESASEITSEGEGVD